MNKESFPDDLSGRQLSVPDVVEALDGLVDPRVVEARLREWHDRQLESQAEEERHETACNLVLRYDEYMTQLTEGGLEPSPVRVIKEASRYTVLTRDRGVNDGLDQLLQNLCLTINSLERDISSAKEILMSLRDEINQVKQQLIESGYSVE